MTRLYIYLVGGLVAALAFLGLFVWGQQGHQKARSAANEARVIATQRDGALDALRLIKAQAERDREVLRKRIAVAELQQAELQSRRKELNRALQDSPDWARARLPDGVRAALRAAGAAPGEATAPGGAAAPAARASAPRRNQR